ncbi:hypothetical protein [Curtobacterium flaccumfaciens]|uniref:hypothetical protein n=1 Tax=Curtobacterium flaccumfaciens TaxID=2035 RepID=UPI003447082B
MAWIAYEDDDNFQTKAALTRIIRLPDIDRELVLGQMVALRELAAEGGIEEGDDDSLRPIHDEPEMWELRWQFPELDLLLRQYHGEPYELPRNLVSLHLHEKVIVRGNDAAIEELQDIEISQAKLRFEVGKPSEWGTR